MEQEKTHHVCTFKDPYKPEAMRMPAEHPDAFVLTELFYVEEVYPVYFCPHCQTKFHGLVPR